MDKIRKNKARELFNAGKTILIVPCKMRLEFGVLIGADDRKDFDGDFDRLISYFTYYNCDYERGYYPSFYTDEP